ncbi:hypothetical protein [Microscilla marina]|uniref:Terminase n=1 Tax=Microscilla marina ATCC 23134 TaxID=313606 RepID=A1ZIR1_MICM2|nr:hypothetical protein [Microscilla marina]EAY29929.1 hypothetical protein M23134_05802 [Microscilla marina ATCC 23134]
MTSKKKGQAVTVRPSKPQFDIYVSRTPVNLFMAGQGAGKTHGAGLISFRLITNFPGVFGFMGANTDMQLTDSTLYRVFLVWKDLGLEEYDEYLGQGDYVVGTQPPRHFSREGHAFKSYRNKISFWNGCVVFIGSLENYKAHDGKEFAWAILDETKDTREEAVQEVILGRLRQQGLYISQTRVGALTSEEYDEGSPVAANLPFNPLYIFTSPAKVPWINDWFELSEYEEEIKAKIYDPPQYFKKKVGGGSKFVVISATHLNLKNLPSNYIQKQEANLASHRHGMLIYGDPLAKSGGEFWKQWDASVHSGYYYEAVYDPAHPLDITWDFNVHPYVTCIVIQVFVRPKEGMIDVYILDEILGKTPRNTTPHTCENFLKIYQSHQGRIYVHGDPSGKNKQTKTKDKRSDFKVIAEQLKPHFTSLRDMVLSKAPSISESGDFINLILEKQSYGIRVHVDKARCKTVIREFEYTKEAEDGTISKKTIEDTKLKIRYQPFGHISDAIRYFFVAKFAKEYKKFRGKGTSQRKTQTVPRKQSKDAF